MFIKPNGFKKHNNLSSKISKKLEFKSKLLIKKAKKKPKLKIGKIKMKRSSTLDFESLFEDLIGKSND